MSKKKTIAPECKGGILPHLSQSPVTFADDPHGYYLEGKKLSGVTSLLSRQLFPDKYDGIPEHILRQAAERGTIVHSLCEFEDNTGLDACHDIAALAEAAHAYTRLREAGGFAPVETEYLVSDLEHVASKIDCVWRKDDAYVLCDIKTTQKYDELYLRWQLSIYAFLFERQNMGADVSGLYAAWLPLHGEDFTPSEARLIPVERIPDDEVRALLEADREGVAYVAPEGLAPAGQTVVRDEWLPEVRREDMDTYFNALQMLREAESVKKQIEDALREAMKLHGVKSWDTGDFKATYILPSESVGFDAKAFAADYPDIYQQYMTKKTLRKESIKITIRK